jgi:Ca-activated chloride channel family protein
MDAADFADDTKDGGEIGSGHRVTALYELIPAGSDFGKNLPRSVYQTENAGGQGSEWCTLNLRYKLPGQTESTLETFPFAGEITENPSENLRFAAAVAECAMVTRGSEFKGTATYTDALTLARSCASVTGDPYKEEFVYLLTLLERKGQ